MLPTRWDPFRELARDLGTLHRQFDDLFRGSFTSEPTTTGSDLRMPLVNTYVKDNILNVDAELPGVTSKDIDVNLEGRVLTIQADVSKESEVKEENYMLRECSKQSYLRRLDLPEGINADEIHADFEDGILHLTIPMTDKAIEGRKIPIEAKTKKIH